MLQNSGRIRADITSGCFNIVVHYLTSIGSESLQPKSPFRVTYGHRTTWFDRGHTISYQQLSLLIVPLSR